MPPKAVPARIKRAIKFPVSRREIASIPVVISVMPKRKERSLGGRGREERYRDRMEKSII